jgi:hypothetical protein
VSGTLLVMQTTPATTRVPVHNLAVPLTKHDSTSIGFVNLLSLSGMEP